MSNIVVISFADMHQAGELRKTIQNMQARDEIKLDDAAVVVKDAEGNVTIRDENGRSVPIGAIAGGVLGLVVIAAFPIAGIALGAAAGAGVGKLRDKGIDKEFINHVAEALKPENSALFVLVREADREAVLGALRRYKGTVIQSSLSPEAEEALKQALSEFE